MEITGRGEEERKASRRREGRRERDAKEARPVVEE